MAGITLAQAEAKLAEWMAADTKVAGGQSYVLGGRTLTRANAAEIRANIDYWDQKCKALTPSASGYTGPKVRGVTPV